MRPLHTRECAQAAPTPTKSFRKSVCLQTTDDLQDDDAENKKNDPIPDPYE